MNKVQKILKFAMRMEKDAQDFYSYYVNKVKSNSLKDLFRELAGTEKEHYRILKEKYDELSFQDPPLTISWVVDDNFASKNPHILADNSDLLSDAEKEMSDLSIIRMAYLIENDFAHFYKNAIEKVDDPNAKKLLGTLADWEEKHREMFYTKYQQLLEKHWDDISSIIFTK